MVTSAAEARPAGRQGPALIGFAGALLSGIGDVLILGRPCSGRDFDRAAGQVPLHIDADNRWRSMWNGAGLPARRIHVGTLIGYLGSGVLQWRALQGISQTLRSEGERRIAIAAATAFALSGVITHQCCGTVILAYRKAAADSSRPASGVRRSPRSATGLLAASAAASLTALAAFSASLAVPEWSARDSAFHWRSAVTPLPYVTATLLTFGAVPAPVGGYVRPASINVGLLTYFAVTAVTATSGQR